MEFFEDLLRGIIAIALVGLIVYAFTGNLDYAGAFVMIFLILVFLVLTTKHSKM